MPCKHEVCCSKAKLNTSAHNNPDGFAALLQKGDFFRVLFSAHCVWKSSSWSKSRTLIRQKQGCKEHHINIAKAWKAESVSTYERKPWPSPITLSLWATGAPQPRVASAVFNPTLLSLIERLVEQKGDQSKAVPGRLDYCRSTVIAE